MNCPESDEEPKLRMPITIFFENGEGYFGGGKMYVPPLLS